MYIYNHNILIYIPELLNKIFFDLFYARATIFGGFISADIFCDATFTVTTPSI